MHLDSEEVWIANLSDMTKEWEQREDLEQALIAANSANIAKSNFLSNMSHDIRTPMNAILGMADIAKQYAANPEKVTGCMEKISYSSKHLLSLIDEVLDMSGLKAGKCSWIIRPSHCPACWKASYPCSRRQSKKKS